jgi:Ca-activated chloride channel family protein
LLKDKIIKGEIEERDNAFKVYDDAMIKGNGAVLLDQERPNIFTLSVGNLNPGSEAGIEIEYISVPDFRNNNLRFFLPTTISPRYIPAATPDEEGIPVVNKVHPEYAGAVSYGLSLKVNVLKTEGIDINSISSPSHKVRTGFNESCYTVEFTSETVSMDRDFVLEIGYGKAALNRAIYFNAGPESFMQIDFNPDLGKYMQESSIGSDNSKAVAPDSEVVFVLDCSGSMEGSSIAQAKKSLEILIKALSPGQMFNIYRFGSSFDKFSLRGEQFDEMSLNAVMDFLAKTDASFGGTEILAPLKVTLQAAG